MTGGLAECGTEVICVLKLDELIPALCRNSTFSSTLARHLVINL